MKQPIIRVFVRWMRLCFYLSLIILGIVIVALAFNPFPNHIMINTLAPQY
jgi:hypothetical protein